MVLTLLFAMPFLIAVQRLLGLALYPWGDFRVKAGWLSNGRYEIQARVKI